MTLNNQANAGSRGVRLAGKRFLRCDELGTLGMAPAELEGETWVARGMIE
jgi:hypothetical protein